MLDNLKIKLGIDSSDTSQDELLSLIIETAQENFEILTNADPDDNEYIVLAMAVEDYNRVGSEGISSLSFGAGSENTLDNYTSQTQKLIKRRKKLRFV